MSSMLELLIGDSKGDFLSMAAVEARQSFRPRADGSFEYFPDGASKPGYLIDPPTRDWIMRIRRRLGGLFFALAGVISLMGLAARDALHGTYTLVWIIVAAGAIGGVVLMTARHGARRMVRSQLRSAPAVHGLSEAERRALLVRRWKEVPRQRLILVLLMPVASAIFATAYVAVQGPSDTPLIPRPI